MGRIPFLRFTAFILALLTCLGLSGQAQDLQLKFEHINSDDGLSQNTINAIAKDKYGFMWFGTESGLCRYDGYKFRIYRHDAKDPHSITGNKVLDVVTDEHQTLWIQTFEQNVVCRYNYKTDDFERIPSNKISPALLNLIRKGNPFLSPEFTAKHYNWSVDRTSNSLVQQYLPTGKEVHYSYNSMNPWSLNSPYVSRIFFDKDQILWVGTYNNGINKANVDAKPFHYFYHDNQNSNSIADNDIGAFSEDRKGNIWVGTRYKGISVFSPSGKFFHLRSGAANNGSAASNKIRVIFSDSHGNIWVGSRGGLDRYTDSNAEVRHYEQAGLKGTPVYGAGEDGEGDVWFATWKGVYKYFFKGDSIHHFDFSFGKYNRLKTVVTDDKRRIWIGTEGGGVLAFTEATDGRLQLVRKLTHNDGDENTISDDRITIIFKDHSGYLWFGTGYGLDRYDPQTSRFLHFTVSPNGIADVTIAGITEDKGGSIWVSHKKGISEINGKTLSVKNYSVSDGLQGKEFSEGAVMRSRFNGMIYFGGNNGFNSFSPDSIKAEPGPPPVLLTELQILNKPVNVNMEVNGNTILKRPLYLTDGIELTYRDKSLAIEFAALNFRNPSANRYAYMLEGFDKDWIFTDASHRMATYSNLDPGTYTFKVKAANGEGIWNARPRVLQIRVYAAWWASTIAYVFYSLIMVSLLFAFYYYSIRFARLKSKLEYESILHENENALHERKIQFFTNISHEIKTPLSLILAPIDHLLAIAKDNKQIGEQLRTMKASGDRLLKIVTQLLDFRRLETGHEQLELQYSDIASLIRNIVASFHTVAAEKKIQLSCSLPEKSIPWWFDADKIEIVLNNLLSNAFKFTPEGGLIKVELHVMQDGEQLLIRVTDNGTGISAEEAGRIFKPFEQGSNRRSGGTGLGLSYTKALVDLHGGQIMLEDHPGEHLTCFQISLPKIQNGGGRDVKSGITEYPVYSVIELPIPEMLESPIEENALLIDGKSPLLLLVEDNDEMRKYLKNYFASFYQVSEARNGIEGLDMARAKIPDIIVSDVMMPEMDGMEFSRRLKSDTLTSHIPVILLTAKAPIEYQIEGIGSGADDYIVKPFDLTLLTLKMRNILLSRLRLREKYRTRLQVQSNAVSPASPDEKLLKKVMDIIDGRIGDPDLNNDEIAEKVGMSRAQFYRKIKALTDLTPTDLIKELRMNRARELLLNKKFNVNEISYMVGYTDTDYFRRCFKGHFGVPPSEFLKKSV
ncbi:response regulator [Mucilaginibacter sp. HMF5004]|uniref:hybrid sensor histidine kinase/response regulator transcription factor n=1 Tax=Mucilaginibacter rivuli TaxID=2857527 RepID=UPI001C5E257A|nr:hybrid sensor histidine kinase/response regulator transcription factor [Mucilaginibacter rivuli]MBW4888972.1 response regulator [Mucilaginibacter rivuli]